MTHNHLGQILLSELYMVMGCRHPTPSELFGFSVQVADSEEEGMFSQEQVGKRESQQLKERLFSHAKQLEEPGSRRIKGQNWERGRLLLISRELKGGGARGMQEALHPGVVCLFVTGVRD